MPSCLAPYADLKTNPAKSKKFLMGRCLKQYDKDYMKMAMLKQEETFRQQVHELHRLYRVQKLLMNDMKAGFERQRKPSKDQAKLDECNSENETDSCSSEQKQRRRRQVLDLELPAEAEEESELELTLATGSTCRQRNKENSSDSGASFSSSSSAESFGVNPFQVPDINLGGYRNEIMKSKFNGEERVEEERAMRPPWLLQCFSLNMT